MIPVGSMGTRRNTIQANGQTIKIQILGEISGAWWEDSSATSVAAVLQENPTATRIEVDINTDGGDVFETMGMMSLLAAHPGRVITTNMGKALSAGALLMQCGDERRASKASMMMIHRAWAFVMGNAEELDHQADVLRKVDAQQVEILADKSSSNAEEIGAMLDAETWLTTSEQLAHGLIDSILDSPAAMASVRPGRFRNTPAALLAQPQPDKAHTMAAEDTKNADKRLADKPDPKVITAAVVADRERAKAIRRSGATLKTSAEVIEAAIEAGDTVAAFNARAIDLREQAREPHVADGGRAPITAGDDQADKYQRGIVGALIDHANMTDVVEKWAKAKGEKFDPRPREFMGKTLLDFARESVERAGGSTRGKSKMEIVAMAFSASGGYSTTGNFPIAFEEALHKLLLAEYTLQEMTWNRFCATGRLNDFRPHNRYRMSELGVWQKVNEHGEYKNIALPDARRETIQADKHGNIIAVTREMIINDDMDTVTRQTRAFARAGAFTVEVAVYALLAENANLGPNMSDGNPLYDASHGNISTSAALSVAALDADRVVIRRQKDDAGKRHLNYRPHVMVIATELWSQAGVLNDAEFDVDPVDTNLPNLNRAPNKVRGMLTDIVDAPELPAGSTQRYIFTNPAIQPVIEVGFLEGIQEPQIERREGWRVDGVEWKGRHEFGVAAVDFKGTVYNAGS